MALQMSTTQAIDGPVIPFPWKLYSILEEAETNPNLHSIVSWFPNGYGFRVHDTQEFFEKVMKKHFKTQSRYQSFTRQLYIYGFSKLPDDCGPYLGGFSHPSFTRHDKHSYLKISRTKKGRTDRRFKKPQEKKVKKRSTFHSISTSKSKQPLPMVQRQLQYPKFILGHTESHDVPEPVPSSARKKDVQGCTSPSWDNLISSSLSILDQTMSITDPETGLEIDPFFPESKSPAPGSLLYNNEDEWLLQELEPRHIEEMMARLR